MPLRLPVLPTGAGSRPPANASNPDAQAVSGAATRVRHLPELWGDPYPAVRGIAARSLRSERQRDQRILDLIE